MRSQEMPNHSSCSLIRPILRRAGKKSSAREPSLGSIAWHFARMAMALERSVLRRVRRPSKVRLEPQAEAGERGRIAGIDRGGRLRVHLGDGGGFLPFPLLDEHRAVELEGDVEKLRARCVLAGGARPPIRGARVVAAVGVAVCDFDGVVAEGERVHELVLRLRLLDLPGPSEAGGQTGMKRGLRIEPGRGDPLDLFLEKRGGILPAARCGEVQDVGAPRAFHPAALGLHGPRA